MRYDRAETGTPNHAERFRLRLLAHALENWNHLTGSLDRLDVDPLPHQIQLVHRILSSGNYNWLIADDVGLGKTIEVGLLLAALKRKGQARRVLIVAPAGLVRQWQDELKYKFDQDYKIYGLDFAINRPEHWKGEDHVIVSIDLAKREQHLQLFKQAGGWDVIVFDEGHKLTRHGDGERSERYRLAEMLREMSDAFLLLSGTPHQGYADRFIALLELVRPDLKPQIQTMEANPEVVGEMILRNRKSEVTDADGNFIFKGQQIHRVPVEPSPETRVFQQKLQDYLRRGYKAGESGGNTGRAIGFVMTTYRKLASSSIAAIERALNLRLDRLSGAAGAEPLSDYEDQFSLEDLEDGGDEQDDLATSIRRTTNREFFDFEAEMIHELLDLAVAVRRNDEKLRLFLDQVVEPLVREGKKLLVFTEYRATQTYLEGALRHRFPELGDIALINGSMKLDEKRNAIEAFEGPATFMISTEAGGEGLNLHRSCHVMVNYDMPWNPARLVQRIGRLYRYGQQHTVVVFNLHAQDTFDNSAIDLMMRRVEQIVQDMAPVNADFHERLYAEILGELLENLDLSSVLRGATMQPEKTEAQVADALARAQRARNMQEEIFTHVAGFDPNGLSGTLGLTMRHVDMFIQGMLPLLDIEVLSSHFGGRAYEIRLPDELKGQFGEFGQRTIVRVTTDRRLVQEKRDLVLLDFETAFFQYLVAEAKEQRFDGLYAPVVNPQGQVGVFAAFNLRWQNDQGEPTTVEFVTLFGTDGGSVEANPPFVADWLAELQPGSIPNQPLEKRQASITRLIDAAGRRLTEKSTRFNHPNGLVALAAADAGLAVPHAAPST